MFLWRATKASLPTKCNLAKRRIITDQKCELCHKQKEDEFHALWSCPLIQATWAPEDWTYPLRAIQVRDFYDMWCSVVSLNEESNREKFGVICWALWHRLNKARLNKPVDRVEQINTFARGYLEEFLKCNARKEQTPKPC